MKIYSKARLYDLMDRDPEREFVDAEVAERLHRALLEVLAWAAPIAGDNQDKEAAEAEELSIQRANLALLYAEEN